MILVCICQLIMMLYPCFRLADLCAVDVGRCGTIYSWDEVHRRAHARRFCPLPTTLHSPSGSNRLPLIFCSLCYSFAIFVIHSLRSASVSFPSLMLFVCNICHSLLSSTAGSRRRCRYELSLSASLISTSLRLLPRHRFRFRFDMIPKWWQVGKPPRERRWRCSRY